MVKFYYMIVPFISLNVVFNPTPHELRDVR